LIVGIQSSKATASPFVKMARQQTPEKPQTALFGDLASDEVRKKVL
jgi:hypothetical protein